MSLLGNGGSGASGVIFKILLDMLEDFKAREFSYNDSLIFIDPTFNLGLSDDEAGLIWDH